MTQPMPGEPGTTGPAGDLPAPAGAAPVPVEPVVPAPAAPLPWASADALADPAGTTAAMDLGSSPAAAAPGDGMTPTPSLEPVVPGAASGGGRSGSVARIAGYLVAAVAGGAIVFAALAATGKVDLGTTATPAPSAAPGASLPVDASTGGTVATTGASAAGSAPILGDGGAPVLIEVWADYQCPYCGLLSHAVEPTIIREYVQSGQARLVYRDFAFLGDESVQAAGAARCAGQQGAYWRFHDLLFASQQGENQGAFAPKNLMQLAGFAGLDAVAFAACMDAGATMKDVLAETEAGRALGIESTPTLHVTGPMGTKLVKGLVPMSSVEDAVTFVLTGVEPSPTPGPSAAGSPAVSTAPSTTAAPSGTPAP